MACRAGAAAGRWRSDYHPAVRPLLALLLALFCCLTLVGQAVAGSTAAYSDCCLQGCKGMAHCGSAACQACAAPQAVPAKLSVQAPRAAPRHWAETPRPTAPSATYVPWRPPD